LQVFRNRELFPFYNFPLLIEIANNANYTISKFQNFNLYTIRTGCNKKKKPTTKVCGRRGRDHMVAGATATCAVSA
jgi:hypothetical protein